MGLGRGGGVFLFFLNLGVVDVVVIGSCFY